LARKTVIDRSRGILPSAQEIVDSWHALGCSGDDEKEEQFQKMLCDLNVEKFDWEAVKKAKESATKEADNMFPTVE
jgi:hypothetical protein